MGFAWGILFHVPAINFLELPLLRGDNACAEEPSKRHIKKILVDRTSTYWNQRCSGTQNKTRDPFPIGLFTVQELMVLSHNRFSWIYSSLLAFSIDFPCYHHVYTHTHTPLPYTHFDVQNISVKNLGSQGEFYITVMQTTPNRAVDVLGYKSPFATELRIIHSCLPLQSMQASHHFFPSHFFPFPCLLQTLFFPDAFRNFQITLILFCKIIQLSPVLTPRLISVPTSAYPNSWNNTFPA